MRSQRKGPHSVWACLCRPQASHLLPSSGQAFVPGWWVGGDDDMKMCDGDVTCDTYLPAHGMRIPTSSLSHFLQWQYLLSSDDLMSLWGPPFWPRPFSLKHSKTLGGRRACLLPCHSLGHLSLLLYPTPHSLLSIYVLSLYISLWHFS